MVKKSVFLSFVTLLFISTLFNNEISAQSDVQDRSIKIGDNLSIEVFNDGRIAPVPNSNKLSEQELNMVLNEIGYSQKSINNYSLELKRKLVSTGGKVAKGEIDNITHNYISDRESIAITSSNHKEVRKKQEHDLEKSSITDKQKEKLVLPNQKTKSSTCSGGNGICKDGKFNTEIYAVKTGETSKQYQYMVVQEFQWSPPPFLAPKDLAGVHWAPYGQPIEGTSYGEGAWKVGDQYQYQGFPMDLSSNHGFGSDIEYNNKYLRAKEYRGSLQEGINISKSEKGHQLAISGLYAHPWGPNNWSLSIGAGAISLSGNAGLGDEWNWRYNFTVN